MDNVFIAIGGTGAKVAEALVRLLAVGFPTTRDGNGVLTSAGKTLEIWRLDPDESAGASTALEAALKDYSAIQAALSDDPQISDIASSRWAMNVDTRVRVLNPLKLPGADGVENKSPTLRGILDSRVAKDSSKDLLGLFYQDKDLDVEINRGFYQKPFIGAAVMGIFAESLGHNGSPADTVCQISRFDERPVNFFLCGSLHGGTGACGLPVMGQFLNQRRRNRWRLGACLLGPYCTPTGPPYPRLDEDRPPTDEEIARCVEALKTRGYGELQSDKLRQLAEQVLLGFYADPQEMVERAAHNLGYFRDRIANHFDTVFLAGKATPDTLPTWSNGGDTQKNPLNTTEIVAALGALSFFSGATPRTQNAYLVPRAGGAAATVGQGKLMPNDLPSLQVAGERAVEAIRPEQVLLATGVLAHIVLRQIPWDARKLSEWPYFEKLAQCYVDDDQSRQRDRDCFASGLAAIARTVGMLLDNTLTYGWDANPGADLAKYFSNRPEDVKAVTDLLVDPRRGIFGRGPQPPLTFARSELRTTVVDFGSWGPEGKPLDRGAYLRRCWSRLHDLARESLAASA
jgi:hypothetical protein